MLVQVSQQCTSFKYTDLSLEFKVRIIVILYKRTNNELTHNTPVHVLYTIKCYEVYKIIVHFNQDKYGISHFLTNQHFGLS